MLLLSNIIADNSYISPCSYLEKARIFRLTQLECQISTIDYSQIPTGIQALNDSQDWTVVDINKFYQSSDKCSFYGINQLQSSQVEISNVLFVIDAVVDLQSAEQCQVISVAPMWNAPEKLTNVSFAGKIYFDNLSQQMKSKLQLSKFLGKAQSVPEASELGSSVSYEVIESKTDKSGRIQFQSSELTGVELKNSLSAQISVNTIQSIDELIQSQKIIKGSESVAADYITYLYYPVENTDKINVEIAYDINDRLIREIEDQIKDCELVYNSQNTFSCQNYTVHILANGSVISCTNQIFNMNSRSCVTSCATTTLTLFNQVCMNKTDCQYLQLSSEEYNNQCVKECPKFLGYIKQDEKTCKQVIDFVNQDGTSTRSCEKVYYEQECLDQCENEYTQIQGTKVCMPPTNVSCSENNKFLLTSVLQKPQCVESCPIGLFGRYHTCTNPNVGTDATKLVNTCPTYMFITGTYNPYRHDQCHYNCINMEVNTKQKYCAPKSQISKCGYPQYGNAQYGICQNCTIDYVYDWSSHKCKLISQCSFILFNKTHYECEKVNSQYCQYFYPDPKNSSLNYCTKECKVGTIASNQGCVPSCSSIEQYLSVNGSQCEENCPTIYVFQKGEQYQCVDQYDNKICVAGAQILKGTVNGDDVYICSQCTQDQVLIQKTDDEKQFECKTQTDCGSLIKLAREEKTTVCYQQIDNKYCRRYEQVDSQKTCTSACSKGLSKEGQCVESCGSDFALDSVCVKAEQCEQLKIYYETANFCGSTCPPAFAKNDENKQCAIKCSLLGLQNYIINLNDQICITQESCKYLFVYQHQDDVCLGTPDDESINSKCAYYVAISDNQNKCLVTCEQGSIASDKQCVKQQGCEDGKPFYTSETDDTCTECSTTYHVAAEKMYCGDCTTEEYHVKSVYGADQCMTSCPDGMFQAEQICYPSYCNQYEQTLKYTSTSQCVEKCTSKAETNLITDLITLQCQDSCASGYQALLDDMYVCMDKCLYGQAIFIKDNICQESCGDYYPSINSNKLYTCEQNCNDLKYQTTPMVNGKYVTVCISSCAYSVNNTYYQLNSEGTYTCIEDCTETGIVNKNNNKYECTDECTGTYSIYYMPYNHASHATYQCSNYCTTSREVLDNGDIHCFGSCATKFLVDKSKIYQQNITQGSATVKLCVSSCSEGYYIYQNYECRNEPTDVSAVDSTGTRWTTDCNTVIQKDDKLYWCVENDDCKNVNTTFQYPKFGFSKVIYICANECTSTGRLYNTYSLTADNRWVCSTCLFDRNAQFTVDGQISSQLCINDCEQTQSRVYDGMCIEQTRNCNDLSDIYDATLLSQDYTCILASSCNDFILPEPTKQGDLKEHLICATTQECIEKGYDKLSQYDEKNSCVQKCDDGKYSLQLKASQLKDCVEQCYGLLQDPTKKQLFGSDGNCGKSCKLQLYQMASDSYHFECINQCQYATEGINGQYKCVEACPQNYFYEKMNINDKFVNICKKSCVYLYQGNECKDTCTPNIYQVIEGKDTCISSCEGETPLKLTQVVYYSNSRKLTITQCVDNCDDYEGFYKYQFQCQRSCDNVFINADRNECVDECEQSQKFYIVSENKKICANECPKYLYTQEEGNECKSTCDSKTPYLNNNNQCIDACPAGTYEIDNICANGCPEYAKFQYYNQETSINECVGSCSQFEQFVLVSDSTKRCVKQSYKYYTKSGNEYYVQNQCDEGKKYDAIVYVFGMQVRRCVDQCTADYIIDNICIQSLSNCDMLGLDYYVESEKEQQCYAYCPEEKPVLDSAISQNCVEKCDEERKYTVTFGKLQVCIKSCDIINYFLKSQEEPICVRDCVYQQLSKTLTVCIDEQKCIDDNKQFVKHETNLTVQCVDSCPTSMGFLQQNHYCTTACPSFTYYVNDESQKICKDECSADERYRQVTLSGKELRLCISQCPSGSYQEVGSQKCVTYCRTSIYYVDAQTKEQICLASTNDEHCQAIKNYGSGANKRIQCGPDCKSINNTYLYLDLPEKVCMDQCKTQYPFQEYPYDKLQCKKRCDSGRHLYPSINPSNKKKEYYKCTESLCTSDQTLYYGNTSTMQMMCNSYGTCGQAMQYEHKLANGERYCQAKCLGEEKTITTDETSTTTCEQLNCSTFVKYDNETTKFVCAQASEQCTTIKFEELNWCMQNEDECYLAILKIEGQTDKCVMTCDNQEKYNIYQAKVDTTSFYCVDKCNEDQIIDRYSLCSEICPNYEAYDPVTNKCLYGNFWCQEYYISSSGSVPAWCVSDCGDYDYDYVEGKRCSDKCTIYQMNTEINKYECVDDCKQYINSMSICQETCDTKYYTFSVTGYKCITSCPLRYSKNPNNDLYYCQECPIGLKLQGKECVKECNFGENLTAIYQSAKQDVCVAKCDNEYVLVEGQTTYTCSSQEQCIYMQAQKIVLNDLEYNYCVSSCNEGQLIYINQCTDNCSELLAYQFQKQSQVCAEQCYNLYISSDNTTCLLDCNPDFTDNYDATCKVSCDIEDLTVRQCLDSLVYCQWQTSLSNGTTQCTTQCSSKFFIKNTNGNQCIEKCPDDKKYLQKFVINSENFQCVEACSQTQFIQENYCVLQCDEEYQIQGQQCVKSGSQPDDNIDDGEKKSSTGAIVGGVIGAIVVVAIIVVLVIYFLKHKKNPSSKVNYGDKEMSGSNNISTAQNMI